jgi:WD40 repeat protein
MSPDGTRLACPWNDGDWGRLGVFDATSGQQTAACDGLWTFAFSPGGTRLASAGRDRAVWLWDLARGEEVARLQGHTSCIWSLAFSPDGATLASRSGDFTVRCGTQRR